MGCCGSKKAFQADGKRSPRGAAGAADGNAVATNGATGAKTEEFAYARLHKVVEDSLPNPTLETLTIFPSSFTLAAAAEVLSQPEEPIKQQLEKLCSKRLVQQDDDQRVSLSPMVRNYVLKLAGERIAGKRHAVMRTYLQMMLAKMREAEKLLEEGDKQRADAIITPHKPDFLEVMQVISKRCGGDEQLLDDIDAPDSLQNPNVYAAMGAHNQAATMWGALYRVLQARIPDTDAETQFSTNVKGAPSYPPEPLSPVAPTQVSLCSLATCVYNEGEAHRACHRVTEAEECYKEALRLWEGLLPDEDSRVMCCLSLIAACLKARKDMATAEQFYERLFAACQNVLPPNDPEFLHAVKELAECLEAQDKVKEAQPLKALAFRCSGQVAVVV